MKKENILFAIVGLFIGLLIGFYSANSINRRENGQQNISPISPNAPLQNQQTQAVSVKPNEQNGGGMMPEISETLDTAKKEPDNFDAQIKAGDMYAKIQKFDTAIEFYEKANQIKPEDYELIVKIGNSYFDTRQFEKAEEWYQKALAKKPNDIGVRTDFGITFVEREKPDLDRAIKEFQTSLQINPHHEPTLFNLGAAHFKKGNREEAVKMLAQIQSVNPSGQLAEKLKQLIEK